MSLGARTHALALSVEESLRGTLALGVLEAEGVRLEGLPPEFDAECERLISRLLARHAGRPSSDVPGVAETRALFHRLDLDPTRTRPSSEALLRRVLQGKGLPRVNPAVDVCNLCSLEQQLPLGLYDRDEIKGDLNVRAGRPGEGYTGIRRQRVNLAGRLLIADENGPFGAPTADSAQTAVKSRTQNLMVVIYCPIERGGQDLSVALEQIAGMLARYCSARVVAVRVVQ
jgi:DNA/RNA-binding domain of Phe-tRNA-synthetase-like protein